MVVRVEQPINSCIDSNNDMEDAIGFDDVTNISFARTIRKAAILLQGRMPTETELSATDEGDVRTVLTDLLEGEVFEQWLMNSANDHLLTRKYVTGQTEAQEALSADTYNYTGLYDRTGLANDDADAADQLCETAGGNPAAGAPEPRRSKTA